MSNGKKNFGRNCLIERISVGGKQINDFTDQIVALEDRLGKVSSIVLRIFPSSAISRSARLFRDIILTLLLRFTENGNAMFGDTVPYPYTEPFFEEIFRKINAKGKSVSLRGSSPASSSQYPPSDVSNESVLTLLDLLASSMSGLSSDFEKFMDYMKVTSNEELTSVHDSMVLFEENLKYWAKTSKAMGGGNLSAIYQHNLMFEIGEHLIDISSSLDKLIATGLPKIEDDFKEAQKVAQTESLALLSTSAFFSSVTASTLGFSFSQTSGVFDVVNFFWFCSLIFSIASVMNSLLAYSWKHSVYRKRSNDDQLPWFISLWSKETPLFFLVISAMMFSVGLCLFSYASQQSKWTSAVTTTLTGLSALGIAGATAWFILEFHSIDELWLMAKTLKEKLSLLWTNTTAKLNDKKYDIKVKLEERIPWLVSAYRKAQEGLSVPVSYMRTAFSSARQKMTSFSSWLSGLGARSRAVAGRVVKTLQTVPRPISRHNSATLDAIVGGTDQDGKSQSAASDLEKGNGQRAEEGGEANKAPLLSFNSAVKSAVLMKRWRSKVARKTSVQESPIDGLIGAFETIKPKYVEDIQQYVDCMTFSPDGNFLAICNSINCKIYSTQSLNCLATIEDTGEGDNKFSGSGRIVWSPRGSQFIIVSRVGVLIYEMHQAKSSGEDPEIQVTQIRSINCSLDNRFVTSVVWFPQGEAFVTVNNFSVRKYGLVSTGQPIGSGTLSLRSDLRAGEEEEISISDVLYIGRKPRLIIAATSTVTFGSVRVGGHKSKSQTQLIVYDLEKHAVESRIPVFSQFRGLNLSKDQSVLLVGYVDKPPQLWNIDGNSEESSAQTMLRLSPQCAYESKLKSFTDEFCRGRTFFYGNNDEFVICWDYYNDEFHVWDRQYAVLLYTFSNWYRGGSLQSMDVNRAHHALMFATGSFNGDLTVWRTGRDEEVTEQVNEDPETTTDVHQEEPSLNIGETGNNAVTDALVTVDSPSDGDDSLNALIIQPGLQA
ncbi:hypothetical protein SCHPADRAFT_104450 [Schizopora paradoxa]|uniref:WD40 repeat-like protein n=1 Tax=Schizopora paradoxa TaxID=27342 RepID=A0A0H2S3N6_9AGAM|nr:hypothetical protein SCHPADRAFT_104450 [Schizopora paradoxa]